MNFQRIENGTKKNIQNNYIVGTSCTISAIRGLLYIFKNVERRQGTTYVKHPLESLMSQCLLEIYTLLSLYCATAR